jgi:Arc/MetJ family transcription regulator
MNVREAQTGLAGIGRRSYRPDGGSRTATDGCILPIDLARGPGQENNVYDYQNSYTSMRTNIVIDDRLMNEVLAATGLGTKREAVELGLRTLLRLYRQAEIRRYRGKLPWTGDLEVMRLDT